MNQNPQDCVIGYMNTAMYSVLIKQNLCQLFIYLICNDLLVFVLYFQFKSQCAAQKEQHYC
ncbi:hypothetical protein A1QC_11510 [Vibrio rumoiensis 1S-45]|uniref:Uncharacterized protein n=1 Tax=Vibrio rumoiensis 1S-45 TaxID=1188252 RepID=A0A1E5E025_9VIBR|nr:hypothetical protein A1QC_11510 [Vibrio rumoiensis 1S-45]